MLKLIEGSFYSSAHEDIKNAILASIDESKRVFLIVPEQQTVIAETEMTDFLPSCAPLTFEVTNFSRFANTAFRSLGGIAGEYSDRGREALIMWRTLTELSPFLKMTEGKREISAGLVERAMSAITDMQILGIDADTLSQYAEHGEVAKDARLAGKISDLSKFDISWHSLPYAKRFFCPLDSGRLACSDLRFALWDIASEVCAYTMDSRSRILQQFFESSAPLLPTRSFYFPIEK